jgi:hypothetical protein
MPQLYGLKLGEYEFPNLDKPEFENAGRVHDWRNHVPDDIKEVWGQLSYEAKFIAAYVADEAAGKEEWD